MNYIELKCKITPYSEEIAEILIAELNELGFESFVESETGLLAYIQEDIFNEVVLSSLYIISNPGYKIEFNHKTIEQENWNENWEKNYFEPIIIENQCVVRSSFHDEFPDIKYQVTIDPKMAFGTGHHETTSLMIKEILFIEIAGKSVLDMGCGTGVLAILSAMKGAKNITAIDIDQWSYNNTLENIELNSIAGIKVKHGDVSVIDEKKYDIIYANINKNVLLNDISEYSRHMNKGAFLLLSGFYNSDFEDIDNIAKNNGLELVKRDEKNNWSMLKYLKK